MAVLAFSSNAAALERPSVPEMAWEEHNHGSQYGLYIVGDSLSFGVPYGTMNGIPIWGRGGFGWTTYAHNHQIWGANGRDSFADAAASNARIVYVMLGTNDIACMTGCAGDAPQDDSQREAERGLWYQEIRSAVNKLLDADKCVMWAGPREEDLAKSSIQDAQRFNDYLRALQGQYPARFFYLDYSAFSYANADVRFALDVGDGTYTLDHVHPQTAASRLAIANWVFDAAKASCKLVDASPTCALTAPSPGGTLSGSEAPLSGIAHDDFGVVKAQFYVDGRLLGTDTTNVGLECTPRAQPWSTIGLADGNHDVRLVVSDTGDHTCEAEADVIVANHVDARPVACSYAGHARRAHNPAFGLWLMSAIVWVLRRKGRGGHR